MNNWTNKQTKELTNKQIHKQMNKQTSIWMNKWLTSNHRQLFFQCWWKVLERFLPKKLSVWFFQEHIRLNQTSICLVRYLIHACSDLTWRALHMDKLHWYNPLLKLKETFDPKRKSSDPSIVFLDQRNLSGT